MQVARSSARTPSKLSRPLLRDLDLYALAASAAGVGLLVLTTPAQAKIVYTKTRQVIGYNGIYDLDLNHDGTIDFIIARSSWSSSIVHRILFAQGALGNSVIGAAGSRGPYASALKSGAEIGPHRRFGVEGDMVVVSKSLDFGTTFTWGKWTKANDRYLGLKFEIKGKFHYGWARLNVRAGEANITATLTGYAYETVANRSIQAGETKGDDMPAEPGVTAPGGAALSHTSLGALALGASDAPVGRQP